MAKTDLQRKIEDKVTVLTSIKRAEKRLSKAIIDLDQAYDERDEWEHRADTYHQSIEKLEGLSTKAIFHKILGNHEEQLEESRQKYLQQVCQIEEVGKRIDILEYEIGLLKAKISQRKTVQQELEALKVQREQEILTSGSHLRQELLVLSVSLEKYYAWNQELQEALEAGQICNNLLQQMTEQLRSVSQWGSRSPSDKRVRHRRRMRRDAMDRARNLSYQVRHYMKLLETELQDLDKGEELRLQDISSLQFSEVFFQSLLVDWISNQRIYQVLITLKSIQAEINILLKRLANERHNTDEKLAELKDNRDEILLT